MAKIAYVKQADIFFEHLTVRDQLGYTAVLRLPQQWTHTQKNGRSGADSAVVALNEGGRLEDTNLVRWGKETGEYRDGIIDGSRRVVAR